MAAIAVLTVVAIAGTGGGGKGSEGASTPPSGFGALDDPSLTAPAGSVVPVVVATDPAVPKTQLASTIGYGSAGPDVKAVQQRLTDLKFAPGPVDGQFGGTTQQAVWAFEKLVMKTPRADVTGKVTNDMWQLMQDNLAIAPQRTTGAGSTHMEVYLPQQIAAVFTDDRPVLITHISSGVENPDRTPMKWCETVTYNTDEYGQALPAPVEKAVCALAKTPGGIFEFNRRYTGDRIGPLGGMTNPVYFNYGIAIHGAANVPKEPASHGCVRINQTIAKFFPSLVKNGDRVYVWGEDGRQPEAYSKDDSLPSFNYPDPDATTTTASTTTTIAPTTSVAPSTTTPKTSTTIAATPSATTTSVPSTTSVAATPSTVPPTTTTALATIATL
ncbi:MAG: hypothetical protein JWL72_4085 [Ilumatobacteraceae bacterium]|nr:hypothetical protein [Ilumatobacteraceae bacterium]